MPLFDNMYRSYPAGGDAAQHALLEIAGLCHRWRRKPLPDLSDAEVDDLRGFLQERGIL